ncbi:hypothetical protein [Streptomyces sp. NBC_00343]|uniref:hypothetical protein n=1 Tax=Streptomyces sp. NBC_00343 TaxID=2975719 RepID=UPI002E2E07E8|nr:hypothetical protein [Streptomyces sp. NBC_00343]
MPPHLAISPYYVGFQQYRRLLRDSVFRHSILNTFEIRSMWTGRAAGRPSSGCWYRS